MSKRTCPVNVFALKRKLIATETGRVEPPQVVDVLPDSSELATDMYRPRSLAAIHGNSQMVKKLVSWVGAGGHTVCCLSGPVGCGKTTLAHVVLDHHRVIHLRDMDDMFTILIDVLNTPQPKPVAVLIDELENMSTPDRTRILNILTKKKPTVPVLCVCANTSDRSLTTFVKACGTHIQMTRPSLAVTCVVVSAVAPRLSTSEKDEIARVAHGDLRQATILAHQARVEQKYVGGVRRHDPADRRILNVFDAARMAFISPVEAMRYDPLVPIMVQGAITSSMYVVPHCDTPDTVRKEVDQLDDLCRRLDAMCDGDVMDSHGSHQVHEHAHHRYAEGAAAFRKRRGASSPSIPSTISIPAKRKSNELTIKHVMSKFSVRASTDPVEVTLIQIRLAQTPKLVGSAVRKQFNQIKF